VVMSRDTSSCSCIFVALPPPSDALPACWCVSTPVMRAAVCLLSVSAVKRRRVAVLHVCHTRHSLAVGSRCVVVLCRVLVCTGLASLSSRFDLRDCRCVAGFRAVWLCHWRVTHTSCCSAIACRLLTDFSFDSISLMLCDAWRCVAGGWLGLAVASGAMV
jgi:hypothetical protein